MVSPICASAADDIYHYYCEAEIVKDFIDHILQPRISSDDAKNLNSSKQIFEHVIFSGQCYFRDD
jgi:hypothetical protein